MSVLQPVAIGIGKPGRGAQRRDEQEQHGRAAAPRPRRGSVSVAFARARRPAADAVVRPGARPACSEDERWRPERCRRLRGPGAQAAAVRCVRGGNTTMAGRQSGKPSRHSRSFGCRWPSSMNLASSASDIGPYCWPSRARYHCVVRLALTCPSLVQACFRHSRSECAGLRLRIGVARDSNSSAPWRQSSRKTMT